MPADPTLPPPVPHVPRPHGDAPVEPSGDGTAYRIVSLLDLLVLRRPRVIVTPAIVAIDVALFALMALQSGQLAFSTRTLVRWGGLFPQAVVEGDWWRLLSPMWLHGHPLHLILNMVFLWQLGAVVERMFGPVVFAVVYLLAGVLATAVSLQTIAGNGVSVGASGAIFGLVGVLLAVAVTSRRIEGLAGLMANLRSRLIGVTIANLAAGFILPGIDNGAHVGGLVAGLALGALVGRDSILRTPSLRRLIAPIALTIGLAVASIVFAGRGTEGPVIAAERTRFDAFNAPAEARFRSSLADVRARRVTGRAAADAIEPTVMPALREAQRRSDLRLNQTGAALRAAIGLNGASGTRREAYEAAYYDAHQWTVFLARYDEAWRLRLGGLRDADAESLKEGDVRAAQAVRLFDSRWMRGDGAAAPR